VDALVSLVFVNKQQIQTDTCIGVTNREQQTACHSVGTALLTNLVWATTAVKTIGWVTTGSLASTGRQVSRLIALGWGPGGGSVQGCDICSGVRVVSGLWFITSRDPGTKE